MKRFLFLFVAALITCAAIGRDKKTIIRVGSFNLRMDTRSDGDNAWQYRKALVNGLIRFHDFDVFGTQEGFKHQLDDLVADGDYVYIGGGRDDGKDAGEHSAIVYKKDRFELIEHGDFWYSETPDRPGKGWDATCCNRICSWGKFRDKATKKVFFFFNSHYDHQGRIARRESSKLLLSRIKTIAGNTPVFATGDYNATPDSEPMQYLLSDGLLKDAYAVSKQPPYGTTGTFHGFNLNETSEARIDFILVTKHITILRYGVLNDRPYNKFPSDHYPVLAIAEL
jgi:endonuclease/exonuclease/phosphatase family metal-dependent hydrolase